VSLQVVRFCLWHHEYSEPHTQALLKYAYCLCNIIEVPFHGGSLGRRESVSAHQINSYLKTIQSILLCHYLILAKVAPYNLFKNILSASVSSLSPLLPSSFASHLGSRGTFGPGRSTYESLARNMLQILVAHSETMLGKYIPNAAIRTCICVNVWCNLCSSTRPTTWESWTWCGILWFFDQIEHLSKTPDLGALIEAHRIMHINALWVLS
jgi:hypothetical protein